MRTTKAVDDKDASRRRRSQTKRRQRGQEIDAYAAAVILQDYLDTLGRKTEGANMKRGPRFAIVAVLLIGAAIFVLTYYAWNTSIDIFQPASPAGTGKSIPFEISQGESTGQIASDLQQKGLIRNALAFRVWARVKGLDTHLEAGIYKKLNTSMTISDIIDQLLNAQPDAVRVIILEGWRLEQIARQFFWRRFSKVQGQ